MLRAALCVGEFLRLYCVLVSVTADTARVQRLPFISIRIFRLVIPPSLYEQNCTLITGHRESSYL